jgi:hypothetical protein
VETAVSRVRGEYKICLLMFVIGIETFIVSIPCESSLVDWPWISRGLGCRWVLVLSFYKAILFPPGHPLPRWIPCVRVLTLCVRVTVGSLTT